MRILRGGFLVVEIAMGYSNKLVDNGYSLEEQGVIYAMTLDDVLLHTRWYLDNLDSLSTYKVSWHNYSRGNHRSPVLYGFSRGEKTKPL